VLHGLVERETRNVKRAELRAADGDGDGDGGQWRVRWGARQWGTTALGAAQRLSRRSSGGRGRGIAGGRRAVMTACVVLRVQ
jgi:hypothetical protein